MSAQDRTAEEKESVTPVVVWETVRSAQDEANPRKVARPSTETAPESNVVPFPGQPGANAESTVTEWTIRPGNDARPIEIRIVSSGFGKLQAQHACRIFCRAA